MNNIKTFILGFLCLTRFENVIASRYSIALDDTPTFGYGDNSKVGGYYYSPTPLPLPSPVPAVQPTKNNNNNLALALGLGLGLGVPIVASGVTLWYYKFCKPSAL
jgi:hypothetical protein